MLDLVIIGGGIHGTFLSNVLTTRVGLSSVRVIDPHPEPLAVWRRHTSACGMKYLRSPGAHNLDLDFRALRLFANRAGYESDQSFVPPYARPRLTLFNDHCEAVIRDHTLDAYRIQATVRNISLYTDRVDLQTDIGVVRSRYALLAVGRSSLLCKPDWASRFDPEERIVCHLFSERFDENRLNSSRMPVIVGAGASGIQRALAVCGDQPVTVISGHPVVARPFDSDPCFIGPKCYRRFLGETDLDLRRRMIQDARAPGTIPLDVADRLRDAIDVGRVRIVRGTVVSVRQLGSDFALCLANGRELHTDYSVLATGFSPGLPELVRATGIRHGLPTHTDGFPVPDRNLLWHPRLFLAGNSAELELGPSAPNIIGAVNAAKRIAPFFKNGETSQETAEWRPLARLLSTA